MSVTDYCLRVQQRVAAARPDRDNPNFHRWFGDSGKASIAVTHATMGESAKALAKAEPLAARYGLE
jgi:hypothetical protein